MDWTKVLGTVVLLAGVILAEVFAPNIPDEVVLAWGTLIPALWVAKPLAKTVGMRMWDK